MSLLMDALKKAEEAKRQFSEGGNAPEPAPAAPAPSAAATTPSELRLDPMVSKPVEVSSGSALPNLSQHIDSVDADLAAVSTTAPSKKRQATPPPSPTAKPVDTGSETREAAERNAARNVFAVKQPQKSRTPLWLFIGLTVIAVIGGGVYFWWQLQSVSVSSMSKPAAPMQAPAQSTANAQNQQAPLEPPTAPVEARKPESAPLPPLPEPARHEAQETAPPPQKNEPARSAAAPSAAAEADRPIRLSSSRLRQDPTLNRAYDALLADNLTDARRDYEQALRSDPKNTDALLGLATIAARQGQADKAADLYLRVLEADPKDLNAKAGLINLKGQSDPALSESRLKTLLASQPDSAALNFALGNLHARQTRWSDAQQAYFRAYTAEPDNADYLFNLAVSLDHLHQKTLAIQYYQMALNAAGTRSAAFDRIQVKSRLLELQP